MKSNILILFAHPSLHRSEVNAPLLQVSAKIEHVNLVDLYAEYPDFNIDIDREQKRLLEHDVIVFMHPLYWYSTPAILKEWQDLVLEHGFAYGEGGTALQNKLFFNAVTAGGGEKAYKAEGYNHFTLRELLRPFEQTASICGMRYLPPYALFGARTAREENRLQTHLANWSRLLTALTTNNLNIQAAQSEELLNEQLAHLPDVPL